MKKLFYIILTLCLVSACTEKKDAKVNGFIEESEVKDSTIYGVCGEGTMMHTLQLVTTMNDTLDIHINDEELEEVTSVVGGLMCGDRMAVTACKVDDEWVAQRVINITSLLGKWSSLDKNFELTDDGEVKSYVKAESNTWTAWRILNGQLLLNRDTFDIVNLGADSLELENTAGIFLYKRITTVKRDSI